MIIVTGANGKLGRAVVEQLLARMPAPQIGASVRSPAQAGALAAQGVAVRQGDFADPASLARAFAGAAQVLIVSSSTTGEESLRLHRNAIDAAARAGVGRILYTSHMGASPESHFAPMPDHAATEEMLHRTGVAFTSLRNGFYASSAIQVLGDAARTGELIAPEDGPVSWTAHADLAEAAALALSEGGLDGITSALTGAEALDLAAVAAIAADLVGRPIRRVVVPDDAYKAGMVAHGVPEHHAEMLLGMFRASRAGEFAHVDPALARLLGRPPTPFRDVLAAALGIL